MAAPQELTRTHAGPCGHLRGAKESGYVYWTHGYSGPRRLIGGGVLRPIGQQKGFSSPPILYAMIFFISSVWDSFSECVHATWHPKRRWIKARRRAHVDLVDLGPLDPNQSCMNNSQLSISLVKSDGCDLI